MRLASNLSTYELSSPLVDVLQPDAGVTVEILMVSAGYTRRPVNNFEATDRALFVHQTVASPVGPSRSGRDYSMLFPGRSLRVGHATIHVSNLATVAMTPVLRPSKLLSDSHRCGANTAKKYSIIFV